MQKIIRFMISVLACQLPGLIGAGFTSAAIPLWYNTLNKPSFNPPSWVFGPVWMTLYFLIGLSFFLVWMSPSKKKQKAFIIFFVQLLLNGIWSPAFFGLQSPFTGLVVIILLWISIVLTAFYFYKISKTAAALLLPYFLWVSFATILNFSIWQLN